MSLSGLGRTWLAVSGVGQTTRPSDVPGALINDPSPPGGMPGSGHTLATARYRAIRQRLLPQHHAMYCSGPIIAAVEWQEYHQYQTY